MGSLLHPVGPEEPRVYWIRRAWVIGAAAIVVVGLVLLLWPRPGVIAAAPPSSPTQASLAPPPSSAPPSPPATPVASPDVPAGPQPCDPAALKLTVAGLQRVKLGTKEPFVLSVINNGKQACILKITPTTYTLTVSSGKDRIWTTADCDEWLPAKTVTVDAQRAHEFQVVWPVKRSTAGCKTSKQALRPGTYLAKVTLLKQATAQQVLQVVK